MSKISPCKNCPERFTACSDRCPKDARGEYGYKAWKAEMEAIKQATQLRDSIDCSSSKRRGNWKPLCEKNSS